MEITQSIKTMFSLAGRQDAFPLISRSRANRLIRHLAELGASPGKASKSTAKASRSSPLIRAKPRNLARALVPLQRLRLQIRVNKSLSFQEKKMLDRARYVLVSEVSIARGVPEITATSILQRSLSKPAAL